MRAFASASESPRTRQVLRPEAVKDSVADICVAQGTPSGAERARLIDDVGALSALFAEMMRTPSLRLRLDVVNTNSRRKFHIDAITARMIGAYRGTGAQYGISTDGAEPRRVFTAQTGAPIVLRGTRWPDGPPSGLLHRSPPIERTGETRLQLALDPIHDPNEEHV